MKLVQSRDNPGFKTLRGLAHSNRERNKHRQTLLDGAHLLQAALQQGIDPALVVFSQSGLTHPEIAELASQTAHLPQSVFPDALFAEISPVDTPAGVVALLNYPRSPTLPLPLDCDCVVLDGVQDAGNLGTILRNCAAAAIPWVLLTKGCAQAWSPKVLRAGMGAHFSLNIVEEAELNLALAGFPGVVMATVLERSTPLFALDLKPPVAWLFGSEGQGLSSAALQLALQRYRIPMPGQSESLNVAVASGICLFEMLRQRGGS